MPDQATLEPKEKDRKEPGEPRKWGQSRGYKVTSSGRVELDTKESFESPAVRRVADLARQIVEHSRKVAIFSTMSFIVFASARRASVATDSFLKRHSAASFSRYPLGCRSFSWPMSVGRVGSWKDGRP